MTDHISIFGGIFIHNRILVRLLRGLRKQYTYDPLLEHSCMELLQKRGVLLLNQTIIYIIDLVPVDFRFGTGLIIVDGNL